MPEAVDSRGWREIVRAGLGQALAERELPEDGYLSFDLYDTHDGMCRDIVAVVIYRGAQLAMLHRGSLGTTRPVEVRFTEDDLEDLRHYRMGEWDVVDDFIQRVRIAVAPLLPSVRPFRIGTRNLKRGIPRRRAGQRGIGAHFGLYRLGGMR